MTINLIWPDISYIKKIAKDGVSKKLFNETIVESGRSRLLSDLRRLSKKERLHILRVFVPQINKSEHQKIKIEFMRLIEKHKNLQIEWFLIDGSPDTKNIKQLFGQDIPGISFIVLNEPDNSDNNQDLMARYCITRAFIGNPETGSFDTEFLKKTIKVFTESDKKEAHWIPAFFKFNRPSIDGESIPIKNLKKRIHSVSDTDLNVLIQGETGAGKEGVAFFLHDLSGRNKKPFEAINCALFDAEFLISELFGHKKGAFTGAYKDRTGIIKQMDGGTLFLDELPEMPRRCQAMLLRFLQDGRIRPLGSDTYDSKRYNVRIICAGQPALLQQNIRVDLLYRIGEVKIEVPMLKDVVKSDLLQLVDNFLYKESNISDERYEVKEFFMNNREVFENYSWPGNIRQLLGFVKRRLKIGKGEEKEILNEIRDDIKKKEKGINFFDDLRSIISKHHNNLPSSESLKLNYTKLVSEEFSDKSQKFIAKKILNISESVRKMHLKKIENQNR